MNLKNNDDLRNRFTAWLTTLIRRTRIDYLRKVKKKPTIVSIDEIAESAIDNERHDFDLENEFENQKLKNAIKSLSKIQQEIVAMLFYEQMKPHEVAETLCRSEQYIYNIRYRIIKMLKDKMGDNND